jgi:hypothetical protein
MLEHLQKGICPKCSHYESCKTPCYPVQQALAEDNLTCYEKTITKKNGETVSLIFARSRETPETDLIHEFSDTGIPADKPQRVFSTANESPFASFNPRLKQTGIFVDRFFHKFSYEDLGVKYSMSPKDAVKVYHSGVKRVLAVLEHMDKGNAVQGFDFWKEKVEERSGSLPKGQKWFLLNKLFGLRPSQIAEMEGIKGSSSVRQLIIRVSDQLRCGEIRLFDASPEEAEEAKARLDAHREKDVFNMLRRKLSPSRFYLLFDHQNVVGMLVGTNETQIKKDLEFLLSP